MRNNGSVPEARNSTHGSAPFPLVDASRKNLIPSKPSFFNTAYFPRRLVDSDCARSMALQFRYLFVTTAAGLEVLDVTIPEKARRVEGAHVALADAQGLYVARAYAYVAAGSAGLQIVDVTDRVRPRIVSALSLTGNANDPVTADHGPPRVRAQELCAELEGLFSLVQLREFIFTGAPHEGTSFRPLAWSALLRRR